MQEDYKRVSCDFYDKLEAFATLKKKVEVIYTDKDNIEKKESFLIRTLETKNKSEYLISESGIVIRLDQILKITIV